LPSFKQSIDHGSYSIELHAWRSAAVGTGMHALRTIETPSRKIEIIRNMAIVAATGEVGLHQRFCNFAEIQLQSPLQGGENHITFASRLAQQVIGHFLSTGIQLNQIGLPGKTFTERESR
jgi:hypothetical protein